VPGFTVTRGLGPGATPTNLIARGFLPVLAEAVRIIRGGRSAASRAIKDLAESFKISAGLVQLNGKELVHPIINTVSQAFTNSDYSVSILPLKLQVRRSEDIKINVSNVKVRRKDEPD
tara:strand:+ start:1151 stop:1504 length:354 start_codon:yes stop_codon:yes gene_type:complete